MRPSGRKTNELRPVEITRGFAPNADGSVLIAMGDTRVLCTATVEDRVPPFLRKSGRGWITAGYSMLPGATRPRSAREVGKGRPSGRTTEIQRLIGRSLRTVIDLKQIGERQIWIDADVIQADGGTRTASITGGCLALEMALDKLVKDGVLKSRPDMKRVAAISVGLVKGVSCLDLDYAEDSAAQVDFNVVMNEDGGLVEVQGTGEDGVFSRRQLDDMLDLAEEGIHELLKLG